MENWLAQNCEQKFGAGLAWDVCLRLMAELFSLESAVQRNGTLRRCPAEWEREHGPAVAHNREHFNGACTALELWTLRFVFPLLQLLCLGGNVLNLLVYRLPYFGGNSAVHFLRTKAIANLLFVESRILESLHVWLPLNPHLEWLYWQSRPYMITLANLNGTVATWMTMLISFETMACVLWPFSFRRLCSRRPTLLCLVGSALCAIAIHSLFLLTHEVVSDLTLVLINDVPSPSGSPCFRVATSYRMRPSRWAPSLERPYYWVQMSATIVLPLVVMLLCAALIVSRFTLKPQLGSAFSQRRKCVIRLTVATTASHLLLEGPAALSYAFFGLWGASMQGQRDWICALAAGNNALSALNATIPFFLFLVCSSQFRRMSAISIQLRRSSQAKISADMLSQGPNTTRGLSPVPRAELTAQRDALLEGAMERTRLLTSSSSANGPSSTGETTL